MYSAYPGGLNAIEAISSLYDDPFAGAPGSFLDDSYQYLISNTKILSLHREVKTRFWGWICGAPSVKMRVSLLTATDYSTVKSAGTYTADNLSELLKALLCPTRNQPETNPKPTPASTPKGPAGPTTTPSVEAPISSANVEVNNSFYHLNPSRP